MKKIILLLVLAGLWNVVNSQITFKREYPGIGANSILQLGDESYLYAAKDTYALFQIGRLDKFGKPIWSNVFGGDGYNSARSIIRTKDGKFVAAGNYENNWENDAYIIKFDSLGTIIFEKHYGESSWNEDVYSVAEATDGSFLVLVNTDSIYSDTYDFCVLKVSSTGDSVFFKKYKQPEQQYANVIIKTMDNNFLVCGESYDSAFVAKIKTNGDTIWTKKYDMYSSNCWSAIQTPDSGFIIGTDGNMFRITKTGSMVWLKEYDTWGMTDYWYAGFYGIICNLKGNYVTAGYAGDGILIKEFTINGDSVFQKIDYDIDYAMWANSIQQTKDSGYIIAGVYDTSDYSYPHLLFYKVDKYGNVYTFNDPSICLVTVDAKTNKNRIIWERQNTKGIEKYNIYTVVGTTWTKLGSLPYDSLSVYDDASSSPSTVAAFYRISAVNYNTDETPLSPQHKTIHLQTSLNPDPKKAELKWTQYVDSSKLFVPTYYYISKGISKTSMSMIDSVSGLLDAYTDTTYDGISIYYQVSIKKPSACAPAVLKAESGPYSQSLSNIVEYKKAALSTGRTAPAEVYPNPFTDKIFVTYTLESAGDVFIEVINTTGTTMASFLYKDETAGYSFKEIGLGNLPATIYMIKIISGNKTEILKIIKE